MTRPKQMSWILDCASAFVLFAGGHKMTVKFVFFRSRTQFYLKTRLVCLPIRLPGDGARLPATMVVGVLQVAEPVIASRRKVACVGCEALPSK